MQATKRCNEAPGSVFVGLNCLDKESDLMTCRISDGVSCTEGTITELVYNYQISVEGVGARGGACISSLPLCEGKGKR